MASGISSDKIEVLTNANFMLYCARHYDAKLSVSTEEFYDDLKRIKYIKKLVTRFITTGELKERLILNHIIVLNNVFGPLHLPRILYLKMRDHMEYIKPFLILLQICPRWIVNVSEEGAVDMDIVALDPGIVAALRKV